MECPVEPVPNLAPNCSFVLDNGQPCRCPARRGDRFCRHHAPEALALRREVAETGSPAPVSASAAPDLNNPWLLRAEWRTFHRLIPMCDSVELEDTFDMILSALGSREIAPRSAGRLLLAILDRRAALAHEAEEARFRALLEQSARARHAPARPMPASNPFEGLNKYPVSVARSSKTPERCF
jgi:hypothetical protein